MRGFIKMSKYAGMREDLVQAGGGNSSYKIDENRMAIKASGFQLGDLNEQGGYAIVNPRLLSEAFMNCSDLDSMTEEDSKKILQDAFIEGPRASIETFLHAMSGRYTLHTHPVVVNILTARKGGMDVLRKLFPEAIFVPYATPGVELAKVYFKAVKEYGKMSNVIFLQNHGVVVSAETADEVIVLTEKIVETIEQELRLDYRKYHLATKLADVFFNDIIWTVSDAHVLSTYKKLGGVWNTAFCPDCVVFLGKRMLLLKENVLEEVRNFQEQYGKPVVIDFKGQLYIVAPSVKKALEIQSVLSFAAQVADANYGYWMNYLSDREQNFLLHWEVEKYRRNMK